MADIDGNEGIGLDIRHLYIGSDYVGVTPSGTFAIDLSSILVIGSIGNLWVGSPATQIPNNVTNRKNLNVTNITSGTVYIGFSSNVIQTTGYPLRQFDSLSMDIGSMNLYGYFQTGSADLRLIQI
jgi:hypothetical protein